MQANLHAMRLRQPPVAQQPADPPLASCRLPAARRAAHLAFRAEADQSAQSADAASQPAAAPAEASSCHFMQ